MKDGERDFEVDVRMIRAGMAGGLHAVLGVGFAYGFKTPDSVVAYAEAFKKEPREYIERVIAEIVKREGAGQ